MVGGARNPHGTRISRKVTCQKCGKEDHITTRPSKTLGAFCRACAVEALKVVDDGKKSPRVMKDHSCSNCQQIFRLPAHIELEKESLCFDCLKGFEAWSGSAEMTPDMRASIKLEKRSSGVMLRKHAV
ncbi:MAG: hypothetical protein JKY15_00395 [Deltaproteobacteria bacterium]|nr:hypothetical protein [Deltaproteobacteria bacterium]